MKIAIVHEKFTVYAGSERVVEQLHLLFPAAPIYTTVCDPQTLGPILRDADVRTSALAEALPRRRPLRASAAAAAARDAPLRSLRLRPRHHQPSRVREPGASTAGCADRRVRAHAGALDVGADHASTRDRRRARAEHARRVRRNPAARRSDRGAATHGRGGQLASRRRSDPSLVGSRRGASSRLRSTPTSTRPPRRIRPEAISFSSRVGSCPTSDRSSRSRPRVAPA